jgi:hypothetical protein
MATMNAFILLVALIACLSANATATRDLAVKSGFTAPARVETGRGLMKYCLVALMGFQFCSNEIFLIPIKGHANLSPVCCHAITTIANKCWPSMLASLGFEAKKGNNVLLHGYCEAVSRHVKASVAADSLPKQLPRTF